MYLLPNSRSFPIVVQPIKLICNRLYSSQKDEALERIKKEINESKKSLKWRMETSDRPDVWNSKLKLFADTEQNSDFITLMQQPIDLSPKSIKNWWKKRSERIERHMQSYIPERHEILGSDLATAHFVLYRGGSIRFINNPNWMKADEHGKFDLPNTFSSDYKVEAVRCDNMLLYYEGLENIRRLQYLKFLSFHNVKTFDDWCLDRVSGSENPNLEVLDLSGTNITYKGLSALYRLTNLKLLILDDIKCSAEMELSCTMLQMVMPTLKICASNEIHNI